RGPGIGGGVDHVADLGVHDRAVAGPVDGVVAGTGIDAAAGLAHDDPVVAGAAGQDVAGAPAADQVVAGTAVDEVGPRAGGDLALAVPAVDDVHAGTAGDHVARAVAEDVVAPGPGGDRVVAPPAVDAVVAGPGGDGVVAVATLDHDVHGHVGRHFDHVVAGPGAERQLLSLPQPDLVPLAVDFDVEGAVVALAHADGVVARAGGEHQLVAADVAAGIGALARDLDLGVAVQRVDQDRLAVGGAARGALAAVGRGAVHLHRLLAVVGRALDARPPRGGVDRRGPGPALPAGVQARQVAVPGIGRIVPVGRALAAGGDGVERGGQHGHGTGAPGCIRLRTVYAPPRAPPSWGAPQPGSAMGHSVAPAALVRRSSGA